jgi:cell division protein FtsI/penicillin-binding protein 2
MTTTKSKIKKYGKLFVFIFIILFVFRLIYGYIYVKTENNYDSESYSQRSYEQKNYASEKIFSKDDAGVSTIVNSQKYEKTATLSTKTDEFDKDLKAIKTLTKNFNGIIQYEHNQGNSGNRKIDLSIGISPEKFEYFYEKVQKFGVVIKKEITKTDKTNEYKELNAKKVSFEKILISLLELKQKGGNIKEYIELNYKILEIEQQLQDLGVELGNFDVVNEFCTVNMYIVEGENVVSISFIHRVKVAFEWTILYYINTLVVLFLIILVSYMIILFVDKLKLLNIIYKDLNKK